MYEGTVSFRRYAKKLLWAAALAMILRACALETVRSSDDSMAPDFAQGDVALLNKLSYGLRVPGAGAVIWDWQTPQKNDFVVCTGVGDPPATLLRKITAVAGEKVKLADGTEEVVRPNHYFVMAEQNDNVVDSRHFGQISRRLIVGKVQPLGFLNEQKTSGKLSSKVESGNTQNTL